MPTKMSKSNIIEYKLVSISDKNYKLVLKNIEILVKLQS